MSMNKAQQIVRVCAGFLFLAGGGYVQAMPPDWCGLQSPVCECPTQGDCDDQDFGCDSCDDAGDRDKWGQVFNDEIKIRIKFHIFGDGNTYASTPPRLDRQFTLLNDAFELNNIEFVEQSRAFIIDTRFYDFGGAQALYQGFCNVACRPGSCNSEESAMKTQYAENPATQLNIYVVDMGTNTGYAGFGYLPWCAEATGTIGGIVINGANTGGENDCVEDGVDVPCATLVHEMGHNLGLYHTQRGVSEVSVPCCGCWEGSECSTEGCGIPACDSVGDYCCDTPPTATNFSCQDDLTDDFCPTPPGKIQFTDFTNHMGYGPDGCRNHFSDQQKLRTQCWSCGSLTGWMTDSTVGACCRSGTDAVDTTATCCTNTGGTFKGGGSSSTALGGCCLAFGNCISTTVCDCAAQGGFFNAGWSCHPIAWCSFPE